MTVDTVQANSEPVEETNKTTTRRKSTAAEKQNTEAKDENAHKGALALAAPKQTLLPGNRPVEASHLKVVSTYTSVGGLRPIVASGLEISDTLAVSGNRPIALSHLEISEIYSVMGNRPVASNDIDDPETLMGYLD